MLYLMALWALGYSGILYHRSRIYNAMKWFYHSMEEFWHVPFFTQTQMLFDASHSPGTGEDIRTFQQKHMLNNVFEIMYRSKVYRKLSTAEWRCSYDPSLHLKFPPQTIVSTCTTFHDSDWQDLYHAIKIGFIVSSRRGEMGRNILLILP